MIEEVSLCGFRVGPVDAHVCEPSLGHLKHDVDVYAAVAVSLGDETFVVGEGEVGAVADEGGDVGVFGVDGADAAVQGGDGGVVGFCGGEERADF